MPSTSEKTAPSPKRLNKKKTSEIYKTIEPTQKSVRNRQSTIAWAVRSPIPKKTLEVTQISTLKKQFTKETSTDGSPDKKPTIISLIAVMGFNEKSPQYQACFKHLEAKNQNPTKYQSTSSFLCYPWAAQRKTRTNTKTRFH